tara:strand:+ start:62 stop:1294 length:1233 start_codon:yes stop_codon:yes gene_type:complete
MGLLKQTQQQYYSGTKYFTGDGVITTFVISTTENVFPSSFAINFVNGENPNVKVYIDGALYAQSYLSNGILMLNYEFDYNTFDGWFIRFLSNPVLPSSPPSGEITVVIDTSKWENPISGIVEDIKSYQFISLEDIINNFVIAYTGEDKIIPKANRTDIQFHAMRALQELSFDTFKSTKSQEIEVPPSLKMILPHDYVNYVKLTFKDSSGIERLLYPTKLSSDPTAIKQSSDGTYSFEIGNAGLGGIDDGVNDSVDLINPENSDTWNSYKSNSNTTSSADYDGYIKDANEGKRYGLNPETMQSNGTFFINDLEGYIHFGSNIAGQTITLKYISDSLGTDAEMQVHKFAEEAMYKSIMYGLLSTRMNIPEYLVLRYKKERFAETRKAKIRLSNIKLEELTQILRGKSKHIKH